MGVSQAKGGLVLYSIINLNVWLALISELLATETIYDGLTDRWNKLESRIKGLNDIRARLAHNTVWESSPDDFGLKPGRYDTRSRTKTFKTLTTTEIGDFVEKADKINRDLHEFHVAVVATITPPTPALPSYANALFALTRDQPVTDNPEPHSPIEPLDPPQS